MTFIVYISLTSSGFKSPCLFFFFTLWLMYGKKNRACLFSPIRSVMSQVLVDAVVLSRTQLLAERVSQPSSQKNGRGILFFISLGVYRCKAEKRLPNVWVCGQVQKISSSFFDHSPQHHMSSPRMCISVCCRVCSRCCVNNDVVVLEKGAASVVFLQCQCACDEFRLPTYCPSNAQLTT